MQLLLLCLVQKNVGFLAAAPAYQTLFGNPVDNCKFKLVCRNPRTFPLPPHPQHVLNSHSHCWKRRFARPGQTTPFPVEGEAVSWEMSHGLAALKPWFRCRQKKSCQCSLVQQCVSSVWFRHTRTIAMFVPESSSTLQKFTR